jgi:hypothetical protein
MYKLRGHEIVCYAITSWMTKEFVRAPIQEYIAIFHNRGRRHSSIGDMAPSIYAETFYITMMEMATQGCPTQIAILPTARPVALKSCALATSAREHSAPITGLSLPPSTRAVSFSRMGPLGW